MTDTEETRRAAVASRHCAACGALCNDPDWISCHECGVVLENEDPEDPDPVRDFPRGTIVRALRDIDPGIADVHAGDLGVVFGEANCYGDGCGPIVRWLRVVEDAAGFPLHRVGLAGMCNVYAGDVEAAHHVEADPDLED